MKNTLFCSLLFSLCATITNAQSIIGVVDEVLLRSTMQYEDTVTLLDEGKELINNSKIITGTGARVYATFIDGTNLQLGENSELTINEFLFDSKNDKVEIEIAKGAFRFLSGKINKKSGKFTLKTQTATLGIRGTEFLGILSSDELVLCLLDNGKIDIQDINGNRLTLEDPKSFIRIDKNGISEPIIIADKELKSLWKTVKIPK